MVIIAAMGLTISALATDIKAADLNVEIKGCGEKGEVRVALYKKDDKWLGKSSASAAIMAKKQVYRSSSRACRKANTASRFLWMKTTTAKWIEI